MKHRLEAYIKRILWGVVNHFDRKRLKNEDFSILCPNCVGGILYERLNKPFLSPTINLWMEDYDLLKFASDIERYVKQESLEFISTEYDYPVARLGDITIYFNHSHSQDEAVFQWKKRVDRINTENLFVIVSDRCGLTEKNIELLEQIPCKGKILFTSQTTNLKDYMLYLPYYAGCDRVGVYMLDRLKNRFGVAPFDGYFDYVSFFNTGKVVEYKGLRAKILKKLGNRKYEH